MLTPTWNRASTLSRLKASLEAQTYPNFEWLIVDDGSTDGTADAVRQWQLDSARHYSHRATEWVSIVLSTMVCVQPRAVDLYSRL